MWADEEKIKEVGVEGASTGRRMLQTNRQRSGGGGERERVTISPASDTF